jgi:quercetin dioxygenase-like cupin family protein
MRYVWLWGCIGLLPAVTPACRASPAQEPSSGTRTTVELARSLPEMNGARLRMTLLEVTYQPGAGSEPHTHPCAVVGYVLEGTLRFQVKGEPETTYQAGQSFYEAPNSIHRVSSNASDKEPVRFLAGFTCDREAPLTAPLADHGMAGDQE